MNEPCSKCGGSGKTLKWVGRKRHLIVCKKCKGEHPWREQSCAGTHGKNYHIQNDGCFRVSMKNHVR